MLIGTKLQRYEALLDAIHESGHPQVAEALTILCESVEKLESESEACDARHTHHEMRLDRAGIRRLDVTVGDDFMAGVPHVGERCEKHGYWSKPGVPCYMCEPSVPALRTPTLPYYRNTYPGDPPLIFVRQAETVKPRVAEPDPWTDGHDPETCQFPCPVHNPGSFYNVREIA